MKQQTSNDEMPQGQSHRSPLDDALDYADKELEELQSRINLLTKKLEKVCQPYIAGDYDTIEAEPSHSTIVNKVRNHYAHISKLTHEVNCVLNALEV